MATASLVGTDEARIGELAEKPLDVSMQYVHGDVVLALELPDYRCKRGSLAEQVPNARANVIKRVEPTAGCIQDGERAGRTDR